jgi:hypothetical protein
MTGFQIARQPLTNWIKQTLLKKKGLQLAAWWILSVSLVSCKHGAKIVACVTDVQSMSFQCSDGEIEFSYPFEDRPDLECASPSDTEYFMNACKRGEIVQVTQCKYEDSIRFLCRDAVGRVFDIPVEEANNYFCLTPQHRNRVYERCRNILFLN